MVVSSTKQGNAVVKNNSKKDDVKPAKKDEINKMLDDHHDHSVCVIPPTSNKQKFDAFKEFKPLPYQYANYSISQTNAAIDAGETKVRITQTHAEYEAHPPDYVPPVPEEPKAKKKKSRGIGPLKYFLEDKRIRTIVKKQEIYKQSMDKRQRHKIKEKHQGITSIHEEIFGLLGPDWYQELSPKQKLATEDLARCIYMDTKFFKICNSTINCNDNIASLGLVLRPSTFYVKKALMNCCMNDVEFLLILYQLINPRRTAYSLNDRLLLSAVVHLSMSYTLRELHVRIPSPPRSEPPQLKKLKMKPQKKSHYISPYLEPYTYERPPPKYSGIYTNTHVDRPNMSYFDYMIEFKKNIQIIKIPEIIEEEEYNECKPPRGKKGCKCFTNKCGKCPIISEDDVFSMTDSEEEDQIETENDSAEITEETDKLAALEKEILEEWNQAQYMYNQLANTKCVAELYSPTVYISCDHFKRRLKKKQLKDSAEVQEKDKTIKNEASLESEDRSVEDPIEKPINKFKTKSNNKNIKSNEIINNEVAEVEKVQSFVEDTELSVHEDEPYDTVCNYEVGRTLQVTAAKSQECTCRQAIMKRILDNNCQCKDCVMDRENANRKVTKIIRDTKIMEDGEAVKIIDSVKSKKICNCLEKYYEKMDKFEKRRSILRAQKELKSIQENFIVRGTALSPEGKLIYILEGVAPKPECAKCAIAKLQQEEEEKRLEMMPKLPPGRQQYQITGVHAKPEGNIYVLEAAIPMEPCNCMDVYDKFTKKHTTCLQLYDEFIKKIEHDTKNYMAEIAADAKFIDFKPASQCFCDPKDNVSIIDSEEDDDDDDDTCEEMEEMEPKYICEAERSDTEESLYFHFEEPLAASSDIATNLSYSNDSSEEIEPECICDAESSDTEESLYFGEPLCTSSEIEEPPPVPEKKLGDAGRYIILDKIPCDRKSQLEILQRAISKLAEDGFPLAKLPNAYKLPHFKLWMQKRCGKFWTSAQKDKYLPISRQYWDHCHKCKRLVDLPSLGFGRTEGSKYTWGHSNYIKKLTGALNERYYRQLRQTQIENFREFFPTLFSFEFHTKTFADVLFSYSPAKEEEAFPYNIWKPYEYRDMPILRRSRKCK